MSTDDGNPGVPQSIPEHLLKGWQAGIDSIADILDVPVVLLMRITGLRVEVLLASNTSTNPFKPGSSRALYDSGLYCETVTRTRAELHVADASLSEQWRANPSVGLGMRSYLGYPLLLADGRVFGTVCVLDRGPRSFCDSHRHLVSNVRRLIEGQLALLPSAAKTDSLVGQSADLAGISHSARLRRSTELLEAVIDGATDAIFLKDTEGTFLLFNRAAATFTAHRSADVIGKTAEDVFGIAAGKVLREREVAVLTTGIATTVEETIIADGQVRTFLTTRSAQRDEDGKIIGLIGIARNITAMKHAEAALHDSEARWQFAVDSAGDGIWDWNIVSGKVFFSQQCKANLGYADDELGDAMPDWTDKVHPSDLPGTWQAIENHLQGKTTDFVAEQRMRARSGEWRWILVRGKVIERHADGSAVRVIATQTDITARRMAEEALRTARDEAQSAERAKGQFLAAMSHEIRTPMNTVIGMTRLALNTELSVRQRNYLEKVDSAARSLLNIINDVLDFSKIEAGGLTLEDTEFDLDTVFESVSNMTAMKAEEKGLEIIYSMSEDVPRILRGDPLRLGQVLINLLSNAVKFTAAGEVLVSVSSQAHEPGRTTLQFDVKDSGIGLEPGQIGGLFRAFTQLGPHISRKYGGTGLGLAICRQLVEMMGGRIWAEGEPGRGSTFHFTVDVALPPGSYRAARATCAARMPRRILIADDNPHARAVLADIVRNLGLRPTTVESGTRAITELTSAAQANRPYELVLMDWHMPGLDGVEASRQLRAVPELSKLPIILMVTAFGPEQLLRSAEPLGLAGVLTKPVTRSTVFDAVAKVFSEPTASPGQAAGASGMTVGRGLRIPTGAPRVLAGRHVLVVDDNGLNREVVTDLLTAVDMRVDTATDGLEAISKVAERDYDVVLMDVRMPGMDGLDAARHIRCRPQSANLPIIAVTAQVVVEEREAMLAAGMNAHLQKPIDEALLYGTLIKILAPPSNAGFSLTRLGNDPARLQQLLSDFLRDTAESPQRIIAHVEANELGQAAALVHYIRGAAHYMEATALCELGARFERAAQQLDTATARSTAGEFLALLSPLREFLVAQLRP